MTASERFNGRAAKVLRHLAENPKGVSIRRLIIAVEPGCKANNMWGTVSTLVGQSKVRSAPMDGITCFFITPSAFVDGRATANAASKGKRKQRRTPAAVDQPPAPATATAPRAAHAKAAASKAAAPASIPIPVRAKAKPNPGRASLSGLYASVDHRSVARADIAADVAAFLAGGGVIQTFKHGESAASIREAQARFLATRQRGSDVQKARRTPIPA